MAGWVERNPPRPGDAWHPYTTSTRAGTWIAALALAPAAEAAPVVESLWRQLRHLALNVEDEILGNHVIRNARALVLGGLAFGHDGLFERGRALLERELPEQILADGGHYERSPVYHLVVLRDLLELEAAAPGLVPARTLGAMRRFAAALARPDGAPALFNDGALDFAPSLDLPAPPEGLSLFPETGYAVVRRGPVWLAFDCGPFAPPFLPAHAHADALSLQLWLDGFPVVVDPGTSTYEAGPARARERGTRAHATVAVDGRDQFELWGAFRGGPFPRVELLEAGPSALRARVRWHGGVTHERTVELGGDLRIHDALSGGARRLVTSTLPLHDGAVHVEAAGPLPARDDVGLAAERLFLATARPVLRQEGEVRLPAALGWTIRCARRG
jgi:hypothetical protein